MRRRLTIFQSLRRRRHRTTSHLVTHPARAEVRGRSRGASETPAVTETAVDINCAKPSATQKARMFGFGIEHVRVHSCIRALVAAVLSDVRLIKAVINAPRCIPRRIALANLTTIARKEASTIHAKDQERLSAGGGIPRIRQD